MEQEYQARPSADYSLKDGETLHLQLKTVSACMLVQYRLGLSCGESDSDAYLNYAKREIIESPL